MILRDFKAFPRHGRVIGIDWGAARTGLAVSNEDREFIFTRQVIASRDVNAALGEIVKNIRDENATGIVFGLPLRGDGSESDTTRMVRDVAAKLSDMTDVPICFLDETLTSFVAAEECGIKSRRAAHEKLDSESARLILENAIAIINRL